MMSAKQGAQRRPHNPVDSICKKIKSIQKMDQASNPALQIRKFQSRNFDSLQCNPKKTLEVILEESPFLSPENISPILKNPDSENVVSEDASPFWGPFSGSHCKCSTFIFKRSQERCSGSCLRGSPVESCSPYCFGAQEANAQNKQHALSDVESRDVCRKQKYVTSTPELVTSEKKPDCAAIQPPVPKTFPSNERGERQTLESRWDYLYDVSLITEEDLLTTIFWACDIERTGKVAVSKIVDYLRHTTSRGSEDSGLEELCNMLDPDQKDVSLDLETYHAVMGEWTEDCKRKREDYAPEESPAGMEALGSPAGMEALGSPAGMEALGSPAGMEALGSPAGMEALGSPAGMEALGSPAPENISGATEEHVQMNVTSGSLEASGGDVSTGDLDIGDLISCIAELQYNNQKLQEENSKLKLALEAADETSNKLLADNEHLHQQIKSIQPSVLKAKSLEEELEDARTCLSLSEEKREQVVWQNKQLEKEIQSLNIKVTSLQEENMRNCVDTDGLQKKILELSKRVAELEVQGHLYESTVENQEASLIKKDQDIKELKLNIVECSSVIEALRAEKNQLLENVRHMQQELISNELCFPLLHKYDSNVPEGVNSLRCELELAQSSEMTKTECTSLDNIPDHEELPLLQRPEYGGEKFKTTLQNLQEEASEVEEFVMTSLQGVENPDEDTQEAWERKLVVVKQELREKRHVWTQKLQLLEKCMETIEKDFVLMAGNLRRARTEQFHLRKELSARQRELEAVKQLHEESAGQAEALALELQETKQQLEDASRHAEEQVEAFHSACNEAGSLKSKLEEAISEQQKLRDGNAALRSTCQSLLEEVEHQKTTAKALLRDLLQSLCELLCQCCAELESDRGLLPTPAEPVKGKQLHYSRRLWSEGHTNILSWHSSPLLDALTLEISCPNNPPGHNSSGSCTFGRGELGPVSVSDVISEECRWKICSAGAYTDADLPVSITMVDSSLTEVDREEPTLPGSLIPTSDPFPSAQEALASSVASTAPVTGCLVMEEKTPKGLREKEEDVPTSSAAEASSDKDPAAPVSGPIKKEFCPVTEEHKPAFQNVLKQDLEVDQEKKNNKEQSEEAPAVVPSRKGSSPTACGIKGDKAKQNEPESPSEKEVEAEFLRLSLGFKCDLFTLDKRVRLEERSRDLAEENLKKEIANAVKMLEALVPLFEEDNQAQEIIKKLQKSLQFLSQYAARVASRAEMLGAINQESRVSKAVEVMIQHVENLKRTYAKEHAELKELKQVLLQNERSFHSLGDRDESTNKKLPSPFNFKPSATLRRVSIATVPRSAGNAGMGLPLAQLHDPDGEERSERFNRRSSSWGKLGVKQNEKRPSLQRFLSTHSWAEYDEEHFATRKEQSELPAEVQEQPARKQSVSEKGKYSSKSTLESVYNFVSSWASHFKVSFSILMLLAAFMGFLIGLFLHRLVAAEPVGPGNSWTSLQQLLWPYIGLRHNAPPPI